MGITQHEVLKRENKLLKAQLERLNKMVNAETGKDQKRVRNVVGAYPHAKDDLKELKAKIVDMEAKWAAYQIIEVTPEKVTLQKRSDEEVARLEKFAAEEEAKALEALKLADEKAAKKAELEAQLEALND